jgi:ankyrin repeat protein
MPNSQEVDAILRAAVSAENVEVLKREIDAGADIEIVRSRYSHEDGEYKLHSLIYIAIFLEKWSSFNFLIAAGANVNTLSARGTPLLNYAVMCGQADAVAALIAAGADVNRGSTPGSSFIESMRSPIGTAIRKGERGILLDLLRAGAFPLKHYVDTIRHSFQSTTIEDHAALELAEKVVRVADDWAGYVRHHRGVLVSILGKCFGDALPHEVLSEVATHWAPPGGS